jgi:hypothetical protein
VEAVGRSASRRTFLLFAERCARFLSARVCFA